MPRKLVPRHKLARPAPPLDGRAIIAANMRRQRRILGLSQEALAERSGLNRGYLSSIENRARNVSVDNICIVAAALGLTPAELLTPKD